MCHEDSECNGCEALRDRLEELEEIATRGLEVIRERNAYFGLLREVQRAIRYSKKANRLGVDLTKKINEVLR